MTPNEYSLSPLTEEEIEKVVQMIHRQGRSEGEIPDSIQDNYPHLHSQVQALVDHYETVYCAYEWYDRPHYTFLIPELFRKAVEYENQYVSEYKELYPESPSRWWTASRVRAMLHHRDLIQRTLAALKAAGKEGEEIEDIEDEIDNYCSEVFRLPSVGVLNAEYGEGIFEIALQYDPTFRAKWLKAFRQSASEGSIPLTSSIPQGRVKFVSYEDCPKMGKAIHFNNPDMLLGGGVVVPYNGKHYRLSFNWKELEGGEGYEGVKVRAPNERSILRFEETSDPLTPAGEPKNLYADYVDLQVFGVGRSQQTDQVLDIDGWLPACLCTFHAGADFTWTVSAHLDDNGHPVVAWLEGTCT